MFSDFYDYMLNVLDKTEKGPLVEVDLFDKEYIYHTVKELIDKYEISWDPEIYVPADDQLADRLFEAGMELALKTGVLCLDSSRRMVWSRDEMDWAINSTPAIVFLGADKDRCAISKRSPDEDSPITVAGGAIGIPVPEELFVPVMVSIIQESVIDIVDNASFLTTHQRPIRAESPWEVVACWQEVDLSFEAARIAGRPGIAIGCAENSPSEIGELATFTRGGFRQTDWHHVGMISELKTTYSDLIKAVQYARTGVVAQGFYNPILGGYAGGKEGIAIASVAGLILMRACYGVQTMNTGPSHPSLACNTHPMMLAAQNLAFQALSRNTNLLVGNFVRPVAGPGTSTILEEVAAHTIGAVTSGVSYVYGVHSAMGNTPSHTSGLESRFMGEVAKVCIGLDRSEANGMVQQLVALYQQEQQQKPIGKSFDQVYELDSIKPTSAWQEIYESSQETLISLGSRSP
jgi:methylamine--corrinoid protein Co-methyltransferase